MHFQHTRDLLHDVKKLITIRPVLHGDGHAVRLAYLGGHTETQTFATRDQLDQFVERVKAQIRAAGGTAIDEQHAGQS